MNVDSIFDARRITEIHKQVGSQHDGHIFSMNIELLRKVKISFQRTMSMNNKIFLPVCSEGPPAHPP